MGGGTNLLAHAHGNTLTNDKFSLHQNKYVQLILDYLFRAPEVIRINRRPHTTDRVKPPESKSVSAGQLVYVSAH